MFQKPNFTGNFTALQERNVAWAKAGKLVQNVTGRFSENYKINVFPKLKMPSPNCICQLQLTA